MSEYGEDRDKQVSLHNRRGERGERNKYAPVGAIVTTVALPFGIEGAYMWPVAFVVGFGPC
jgi:hypothetical protein